MVAASNHRRPFVGGLVEGTLVVDRLQGGKRVEMAGDRSLAVAGDHNLSELVDNRLVVVDNLDQDWDTVRSGTCPVERNQYQVVPHSNMVAPERNVTIKTSLCSFKRIHSTKFCTYDKQYMTRIIHQSYDTSISQHCLGLFLATL